MQLQNATALVTGGASGLGEGVVRRFVAQGAHVLIVDLNAERGMALAAELGDAHARFVCADVADEASVTAAVEAARAFTGKLDIAVNCAGIVTGARILSKGGAHSLEAFERTIRVNLIGTFNVLRLAALAMSANMPNAEGERGVIINTASIAAYDGQIGQAAYAASKAGIAGMTLPIARDLAREGIRVMTIAPGVFDTPMAKGLPDEVRASLAGQTPFPPRLGQPDEYAQLAQAIVENPMLNGEVIRLDGAMRLAAR
jgi:NAD(P)-dependent dehydrogenase (short-subunit alcohol dehydrogenase family)